jgi:hypothetical protein
MIKHCTRAVLLVLAAGALASCGGSAGTGAGAKEPLAPADEKAAGMSPEAALAQLDLAERDLALALGYPPPAPLAHLQVEAQPTAVSQAGQAAPPPPPPRPAAEEPPRTSYAQAPAQPGPAAAGRDVRRAEKSAPGSAPSTCTTACSALASMERSADHLCGLTGAGDDRCASARERVKNALARVQAACPACAK